MTKIVSPICMSRDSRGNYFLTGTSPDDDFHKDLTKDEARKILSDRKCPPDLLEEIMASTGAGVVMC